MTARACVGMADEARPAALARALSRRTRSPALRDGRCRARPLHAGRGVRRYETPVQSPAATRRTRGPALRDGRCRARPLHAGRGGPALRDGRCRARRYTPDAEVRRYETAGTEPGRYTSETEVRRYGQRTRTSCFSLGFAGGGIRFGRSRRAGIAVHDHFGVHAGRQIADRSI